MTRSTTIIGDGLHIIITTTTILRPTIPMAHIIPASDIQVIITLEITTVRATITV